MPPLYHHPKQPKIPPTLGVPFRRPRRPLIDLKKIDEAAAENAKAEETQAESDKNQNEQNNQSSQGGANLPLASKPENQPISRAAQRRRERKSRNP